MRNKILLLFIILVAVLLRFWQLGINPPSLTWDEASWGYNSYSLGIDAKDEFGRFLPVNYLESFGDFKPPMYAYLGILPVKLFGLTEFATRFPSAFFGVLTVLITYFLVKQIFYSSSKKEWYGLAAAGILSISPWHIMLSRAAFEANVATFFLVCGLWLFLRGVNGRPWSYILSLLMFVCSLYTFNTSRIVAPLLVITCVLLFWRELFNQKKQFIIAGIIGLLVFFPLVKFLITPQAALRFKEVNIFSDVEVVKISNQEIANEHNATFSKIVHNRRFLYTVSFFRHYFDNLNPSFLFITGDGNPKFSTRDLGELYIWDLPFFIIGIFLLFSKKEGRWYIIPLWLVLGIIPAATARETPHALRIEATLPTFQILIAYGLVNTVGFLRKVLFKKWFIVVITIVIVSLLSSVGYFLHGYYYHYPQEYSGEWQYGYKDSIAYVSSHLAYYDEVDITNALGRPYIYYLFYTKMSPKDFREESVVTRDVFGFVTVAKVNKFIFPESLSNNSQHGKKVLYINVPTSVPGNAHILQVFYLENGKKSLVAYTL